MRLSRGGKPREKKRGNLEGTFSIEGRISIVVVKPSVLPFRRPVSPTPWDFSDRTVVQSPKIVPEFDEIVNMDFKELTKRKLQDYCVSQCAEKFRSIEKSD